MNLIEWIEKETVPVVAEKLDVSERVVYIWLNLQGAPQFDNAYKIKMLTRGKLDFNAIYGQRLNFVRKNT